MNIIEYITTMNPSHTHISNTIYRYSIGNLLIGVNKLTNNSYWFRIWMKSNSEYVILFTVEGLVLKNNIIENVTSIESIEMIEIFKKIQTKKQLKDFGNKLVKLKVFS